MYYEKYLKYKSKYIELKKQIGKSYDITGHNFLVKGQTYYIGNMITKEVSWIPRIYDRISNNNKIYFSDNSSILASDDIIFIYKTLNNENLALDNTHSKYKKIKPSDLVPGRYYNQIEKDYQHIMRFNFSRLQEDRPVMGGTIWYNILRLDPDGNEESNGKCDPEYCLLLELK
jgi:hypothetical protein